MATTCQYCCLNQSTTNEAMCDMCKETKRTVENCAALFSEGAKATPAELLTIDRRRLQPCYLRNFTEGFATFLQLKLQARIWIAITQRLQESLTTQRLLESHAAQKSHFLANVSVVENYLNELKF